MPHFLNSILNGPANYTQRHHFSSLWTLVFVLGILLAEFIGVYLIAWLLIKGVQNFRSFIGIVLRRCNVGEKEVPRTFLELIFPSNTTKSAYATEQEHLLLPSQVTYQDKWDRMAGHKKPYSLEVVGTSDDGIRFIIMVPTHDIDTVRRDLHSFLPGLKIREVTDYLNTFGDMPYDIIELKLGADFVLPLQDLKTLTEHDPMANITAHMTKLLPKELVVYQLVAMPLMSTAHRKALRHIDKVKILIGKNMETSSKLVKQRNPRGYVWWLIWYPPLWFLEAMLKVVKGVFELLVSMFSRDHEMPEFLDSHRRQQTTTNPYELERGRKIRAKLDQQQFEVSLRILVASPDETTIDNRLNALVKSFKQYSNNDQWLQRRQHVPKLFPHSQLFEHFKDRKLSPHHLSQQTILSSSELSDLYHFPNTDLTKTEGLVKSRGQELPAPLSIKHSDAKLDVIVGVNRHGGDEQPIGQTLEQRQKHTYIIGKTGMGKTTLLTSSIHQDMVSGKGLAVLDSHGDMFDELLGLVPKHRRKDVVVFDPSDRNFPPGLNILNPGIEFADEDDRNDLITSSVISVFMKLADADQWGPRMEQILRSATMTALQLPNPSLYTLQRLLTEKSYQKEVAETLKDPILKQFWDKEFKLLGAMQLSTVTAPLTNRLGKFITSKRSRHILLQEKSTINIADIMNEGKILLVNLSKGKLGADQSSFFGTILTSFIWMAAYQRADIPEDERRDFFLYVDEFQNFASPDFSEIVSEGRKYHVSLIVSHQDIAQIPDINLLDSIAGNASTLICLKVGAKDEAFILPYMRPEVERGDIVNLAPHHFFMKTTAKESEDAFSGQTVPLDEKIVDKVKETVIAESRRRYGTPKASVEAYLEILLATEKAEDVKKPKTNASKKAAQKKNKKKGKNSTELQGG